MSTERIFVSQIGKFVGAQCPECKKGVLREVHTHDAVEGNATVLQCTTENPCNYTVEIVQDMSPLREFTHSTMEGIPR